MRHGTPLSEDTRENLGFKILCGLQARIHKSDKFVLCILYYHKQKNHSLVEGIQNLKNRKAPNISQDSNFPNIISILIFHIQSTLRHQIARFTTAVRSRKQAPFACTPRIANCCIRSICSCTGRNTRPCNLDART